MQAFAGSLEGFRARKGVFITTSTFTPDALAFVERIERKIVLIDGKQLAELMIEHNVGVATTQTAAMYVIAALFCGVALIPTPAGHWFLGALPWALPALILGVIVFTLWPQSRQGD